MDGLSCGYKVMKEVDMRFFDRVSRFTEVMPVVKAVRYELKLTVSQEARFEPVPVGFRSFIFNMGF